MPLHIDALLLDLFYGVQGKFLKNLEVGRCLGRWNALSSTRWLDRWNALSLTGWLAYAALPSDIRPFGEDFSHRLEERRSTSEWINNKRPVFYSRAQTSDYRILSDVIQFCGKLSATFVSSQPMIEIC
jgi:hypothetical protein